MLETKSRGLRHILMGRLYFHWPLWLLKVMLWHEIKNYYEEKKKKSLVKRQKDRKLVEGQIHGRRIETLYCWSEDGQWGAWPLNHVLAFWALNTSVDKKERNSRPGQMYRVQSDADSTDIDTQSGQLFRWMGGWSSMLEYHSDSGLLSHDLVNLGIYNKYITEKTEGLQY